MGVFKLFSGGSRPISGHKRMSDGECGKFRPISIGQCNHSVKFAAPPNPNPFRFKIKKSKKIGNFVVALINYPDCTNYEGNKICIFKDISIKDLKNAKEIDPHFMESSPVGVYYPIARFVPTNEGWDMAIELVKLLSGEK